MEMGGFFAGLIIWFLIGLAWFVVVIISQVLNAMELSNFANRVNLKCKTYSFVPFVNRSVFGEIYNVIHNKPRDKEFSLYMMIAGIVQLAVIVISFFTRYTFGLNIIAHIALIVMLFITIGGIFTAMRLENSIMIYSILAIFMLEGFVAKKSIAKLESALYNSQVKLAYDPAMEYNNSQYTSGNNQPHQGYNQYNNASHQGYSQPNNASHQGYNQSNNIQQEGYNQSQTNNKEN